MNRFQKITKDIDIFVEWYFVNSTDCDFCVYNPTRCNNKCKEGIKRYFEEEVK